MAKQTNFSELSCKLTKQIDKNDKKKGGIYFTPRSTIMMILDVLKPYMKNIKNILEPSCGSCEFISVMNERYPGRLITGLEINQTIFDSIQHFNTGNTTLLRGDYLTYQSEQPYDLIIGNTPFFVMKKKDVDESYHNYFTGRPNIFILFVIKSLHQLSQNGILCFILPKNFLNCSYYDKTRKYIYENYNIIDIIECNDKYIETQQETIVIIIKNDSNTKKNDDFTLIKHAFTIFSTKEKTKQIKALYENSTDLVSLGFDVSVGNVVWNQVKQKLTDDETKTRLIYSSDILNGKLTKQNFKNPDKKNYIDQPGIVNETPVLLINRGYGVGDYKFNYYLLKEKMNHLIENHVISVKYTKKINQDDLVALYEKIIGSLRSEKTKKFIGLYFGNNALNTTELKFVLPIYDI